MVFGDIGIDQRLDALLRMELLDLAKMFTHNAAIELDFQYHAIYRADTNRLSISQFWEDYREEDRKIGMKSDVVLHALGAYAYTDRETVRNFLKEVATFAYPQFTRQCFALLEEYRVERCCTIVRPGTRKWFQRRHELKQRYMKNRIRIHVNNKEQADARLLGFYCALHAVTSAASPISLATSDEWAVKQALKILTVHRELKTTADTVQLTMRVMKKLTDDLQNEQDMKSRYFAIDAEWGQEKPLAPDLPSDRSSAQRQEELAHRSNIEDVIEAERPSERFPSWQAEMDRPQGVDLLFDHESSVYIRLPKDQVNEVEHNQGQGATDEPEAHSGGRTAGGDKKHVSDSALHTEPKDVSETIFQHEQYGKQNMKAKKVIIPCRTPNEYEYTAYDIIGKSIRRDVKRIERTISQTLERQRTGDLYGLYSGRLGKKLASILTEEQPRLFYKKKLPVRQLDTAFLLLVDCSASMYDKMDETKKGIALFHEALYSLQIVHEIVGFWEDEQSAFHQGYPNCFQTVIDFSSSLRPAVGPHIMQLKPEQDNRDGYAIRVMSERLVMRPEKQKVLLIFSDGEPSAMDYYEEGIVDTHEAVQQARKQGLEVIGIFLADGEVQEDDREMMRNIYGSWNVVVPHVSELPDHLSPLLRKLLINRL